MDKLVKSTYQKDLCLASLVIVYQVNQNTKQKSIKPFNGKIEQRDMTKITGSCPILDDTPIAL